MSSRGLLPLLIATAFGIANGVYVFAPAFKEQNEAKQEPLKGSFEATNPATQEREIKSVIAAEGAASRELVNDATLNPKSNSKSWWAKTSLWPGGKWENEGSPKPAIPSTEAEEQPKDGRR